VLAERCFNPGMRPTVLVDAENVRRSAWPNTGPHELVRRCRSWAEREGVSLVVVFDGPPPETGSDDVEGTLAAGADDRIVELADGMDGPVWLVTSDRELRMRVGVHADRVIGGGSFLRQIRTI
jgi:hypothetical protein